MKPVAWKRRIVEGLRYARPWGPAPAVAGPVVLMYHGVVRKLQDPVLDRWSIPLASLARHLRFLKKHYQIVPLSSAVAALEADEPAPPNWAVITFDDALRNVYENAHPLLQELGIPYTIAVPSGLVDAGQTIWSLEVLLIVLRCRRPSLSCLLDERRVTFPLRTRRQRVEAAQVILQQLHRSADPIRREFIASLHSSLDDGEFDEMMAEFQELRLMTPTQINDLHQQGVAIASHGDQHIPLGDGEPDCLLQREVQGSNACLERLAGSAIDCFVYPYGVASASARRFVSKSGYRCALSTHYGRLTKGEDLFNLPRIASECSLTHLRFQLAQLSREP